MIDKYNLSKKALHDIVTESEYRLPNETGGILVGKVQKRCAFIRYVIGPGENAYHTPNKFQRDGEYSQKQLDVIASKTLGEEDYLGEWHSHPSNSRPSIRDIESMNWVAKNENYAVTQPILLLCIFSGKNNWHVQCFVVNNGRLLKLKVDTCSRRDS